jgi:alkylated DNA repair protein alkB family protein 8
MHLAPHIDRHSIFGHGILALSLSSATVMDFELRSPFVPTNAANVSLERRQHTDQQPSRDPSSMNIPHVPVLLNRCSLVIMEGEARYRWCHGIRQRRTDPIPGCSMALERGTRISLTFRRIRPSDEGPCPCNYPEYCY